ncbi:MAG TPA: DUF21 domain-containing protein [candidate division Zixibacteria bacterium]|nr:DUF21 domain-containing protein [candidate division Zixibacteria bacterium]
MRIIALCILLALSAFFSGSETAFFSLSRFEVQRMAIDERRWAHRVTRLLSRPGRLLIAILAGNMIVNVSATALLTAVFLQLVGPSAVPIAVAIMTVAVLIFGEITPKVIAVEHNAQWARLSSGLLIAIKTVLTPLIAVLSAIQRMALGEEKVDDLRIDEIDMRSALEIAHRQGAIEGEFRELLLHFLTLDRITAEEVMIPRTRVPITGKCTTHEEIRALMDEHEFDVCIIEGGEGERPRIIAKSTLRRGGEEASAWDLAEEVFLVPFSKSVADLFRDLRASKLGKFVVLDEHGDIDGLIEAESLLLEVYGRPILEGKPLEFPRMGGWFLISGETPIADVNSALGTCWESEINKTIAGAIIELFGEIPAPGSQIEHHGWEIRAIKTTPRKLTLVGLKRMGDDN